MSHSPFCPAGCGPLTAMTFRQVALGRCAVCAGVWLDARAYDALHALPDAALHTLDASVVVTEHRPPAGRRRAGERVCPACAERLTVVQIGGETTILLDRCESCRGLWADDQELQALSASLEADKPYFAPVIPEDARAEVQDALGDYWEQRHAARLTLFQSLCRKVAQAFG